MSEDKVYAYTSELKHLRIRANLKQTFFFLKMLGINKRIKVCLCISLARFCAISITQN